LNGYAVGSNGTIIKTVNGGVGLAENKSNKECRIFPNPVSDYVIINWNNTDKEYSFQISNYIGMVVANGKVVNNTPITFSQLPAGVYLISLKDRNGNTLVKRIIKE
jgi:hypothetical protein